MRRDLLHLSKNTFDLIVIGGGIYGACVTWDATLRGLSVALVEKSDFGSATSANSLKIIHGGFRYLQQADIIRMRESIRERRTLMKIAPHLVHPLPVLIPTYGHGMNGKGIMSIALVLNTIIGFDTNRLDDPQKSTPAGSVISREEVLNVLPEIEKEGLTGGVLFYDSYVHNSERLLIECIRSSVRRGGSAANYLEVVGFLQNNDAVSGVEVRDRITGEEFSISANAVVNTSGPWIDSVLGLYGNRKLAHRLPLIKAVNLVTRPLFQNYAVGISCGHTDKSSLSRMKRSRRLFFVPWRGHTLIGTSYQSWGGDPDALRITRQDVENFISDVNRAYPPARLTFEDVSFVHGGLLPGSGEISPTGDEMLSNHYQIKDYRKEGVKGLISVIGVKYTTARNVAEKAVDRVFEILGRKSPSSCSSEVSLHGGRTGSFNSYLDSEKKKRLAGLDKNDIEYLIYNYGSSYGEVLQYLDTDSVRNERADYSRKLLEAEVKHGVWNEMAQKMTDIVFRRTGLGTAGCPSMKDLNTVSEVMAQELGWNEQRKQHEVQNVLDTYSPLNVVKNPTEGHDRDI